MEGWLESVAPDPVSFVAKTYEMVEDSSTNEIVSWSPTNDSFIIWDDVGLSRQLLPTFFKHNNFSSFIRQLNTYGFRKVNPDRWEFANENFVRDQTHLLHKIQRKKAVYSHNLVSSSSKDTERAALEEQIEILKREKNAIQSHLTNFVQNKLDEKLRMQDLLLRLDAIEERQNKLFQFFNTALNNPNVANHISTRIDTAMEKSFPSSSSSSSSGFNKKRRFPSLGRDSVDHNHDGGFGSIDLASFFNEDFSNKLTLEKMPSSPNGSKPSRKERSKCNNEDWGSLLEKLVQDEPEGMLIGTDLPFTSEMLEFDEIDFNSLGPHSFEKFGELQESRTAFDGYDGESGGRGGGDGGGGSLKGNDVANEVPNLIFSEEEVSRSNNQGNTTPETSVNDEFWWNFFANF